MVFGGQWDSLTQISIVFLLRSLSFVRCGEKFGINEHVQQISRILEDGTHSIHGIHIEMPPSYFNYLVPFTTIVTCSDGTMVIKGMSQIDLDDGYMEGINTNESYIQARFAVADLSYTYNVCWLNFGLPIPIWLRGKILNSQYFVSGRIHYKPECQLSIDRAQLESYGNLTVNIFQWMPGGLGNWLLEAITRNAQDRIFETVEKSIRNNAESLTEVYNPCIVFPAMGKMTVKMEKVTNKSLDFENLKIESTEEVSSNESRRYNSMVGVVQNHTSKSEL